MLLAIQVVETTESKPIKALPFVSFNIVDKTVADSSSGKRRIVYFDIYDKNVRLDKPLTAFQTTKTSFYMQAVGPLIKPDTEYSVVVSF